MSEFQRKLKRAFFVNFSRVKTATEGVVEYRTHFGTVFPTTRYVGTKVNETDAARDGLDTLAIVDQIKVHHYNVIMKYIDNELRKGLKLQEG